MLKNIRLHVEKDEERQAELEQQLAAHIAKTSQENFNSFQRYIPSLTGYFHQQSQNISIFCNKYGRYNIVDYGVGRTLYGFDPEQECLQHVQAFCQRAPYLSFSSEQPEKRQAGSLSELTSLESLPAYQAYLRRSPLPAAPELVVVFGLGLGLHIKYLIENFAIKHLIIYEPETQYFRCSVMVTQWKAILDLAKQKGTALYFQIGKDGRDLVNDLNELRDHVKVEGGYYYQHYNHPVFNSLCRQLQSESWHWLNGRGVRFQLTDSVEEYTPVWTKNIALESWGDVSREDSIFIKNITAFRNYFPSVYEEFKEYTPKFWIPIRSKTGDINLVNKSRLVCWYGDTPKIDGKDNYDGFSDFPNKDGLVLGYSGTKLKHYLHYQFVAKTEEILKGLEEERGCLPDKIKSIILFGLGCGYQLQELLKLHCVEKLFICEPNRDFFYASLFSIEWSDILHRLDNEGSRLYINIGDDGSHLFKDLLHQFYAIGPYMLNSTFFYQSYYNGALNQAVAQLREQLQVVISMGEYFDHAYYGITHTIEGLKRGYPFLSSAAPQLLAPELKEVPVFLIGNGPSLDFSIETIKEWKDKAILISCGTSLQVLHRNGIVPDFHAEIEQNRSTFDWACRIGDLSYLKKISLVSCNGIHPDTAALYKDVFVAFKEGESSTVSTLKVIGEKGFSVLKFSFPTVTNFAMNLFSTIGFRQIYLLGVDLGFINTQHHHSTQSGYYCEDSKEKYDYSKKNNMAITVPGNFRKQVFTKHEFKVAKLLLEQSLAYSKIDCYNCSDGAKVFGSQSLKIEDILITVSDAEKKMAVDSIKKLCFVIPENNYFDSGVFSHEFLLNEFKVFTKVSEKDVVSVCEMEKIVERQKELLFASYQYGRSFLFYLLYGTVNYANSVFVKMLYSSDVNEVKIESFNLCLDAWRKFLAQVKVLIEYPSGNFDSSSTFSSERHLVVVRQAMAGKVFNIITDSESFVSSVNTLNAELKLPVDTFFYESSDLGRTIVDARSGYLLVDLSCVLDLKFFVIDFLKVAKLDDVIFIVSCESTLKELFLLVPGAKVFYLPGFFMNDEDSVYASDVSRYYFICCYFTVFKYFQVVVPKLSTSDFFKFDEDFLSVYLSDCYAYDFQDSLCFARKRIDTEFLLSSSGNRGVYSGKGFDMDALRSIHMSKQEVDSWRDKVLKKYPFLTVRGKADV